MADGFRSFAQIFAERDTQHESDALLHADRVDASAPRAQRASVHAAPVGAGTPASLASTAQAPTDPRVSELLDAFAAQLARLRACAAELVEERAESLLADLARGVLGRELALAPADTAALIASARAQADAFGDVVLRVSAADAERLRDRDGVAIDPDLRGGDFALDTPDGSFDCMLATRFETLLASLRVRA